MLSVGGVLTRRPWRRCAKMLGRVWMRAFRSAPPPAQANNPARPRRLHRHDKRDTGTGGQHHAFHFVTWKDTAGALVRGMRAKGSFFREGGYNEARQMRGGWGRGRGRAGNSP